MENNSEIHQLQLEQTGIYMQNAANVLLLFESCITFSQEVEVIWKQKWSVMTGIYAFTRYGSVLMIILNFIPIWGLADCKATMYVLDGLILLQYLCFAAFSALRTYALLNGQIIVAGIVFGLNLVPIATSLYADAIDVVTMDSEICSTIVPAATGAALGLPLGTRISVIVGDILVLLVTWLKTVQSYREARRLKIEAPLATLLLRDGTIYFVVLLMINILQVIERNIPALIFLDISSYIMLTFTPILTCRFVLNLRQAKSPGSSLHSIFVSNAGESLRFGEDEHLEDGEGEELEFGEAVAVANSSLEVEDEEFNVRGFMRGTADSNWNSDVVNGEVVVHV